MLTTFLYMPTLPGDQKPPNKRKFGSVAHKKIRFKLHMFQNSKIIWLLMLVLRFLASSVFLRDASCSLQTNRREFLLCYSYISETLIGWVVNHLKSLIDRSAFFPRNYSVRGGGRIGKLDRGGRGGPLVRNLQIWDLQRLTSLWFDNFTNKPSD